jgi:hypothetical protein
MFPYALLFVIKVEIYLYRLLCKVTAAGERNRCVLLDFLRFSAAQMPEVAWIGGV